MNIASDHKLPDPQSSGQPQLDASQAILLVGGIIYAVGCLPAIAQRGWPPIDPAWEAIPYLWFLPLIVSGIFDRSPDRIRTPSVVVYSLVTAYFDSGTWVIMSPRAANPVGMFVATLFMYGPAHIVIAAAIECVIRVARQCAYWVLAKRPRIRFLAAWSFAIAITAGTIAAPFVWRGYVFANTYNEGRQTAESDWDSHKVRVFRSLVEFYQHRQVAERRIRDRFDPITGFDIETFPKFFGFVEAYNQRVAELVAERGIPAWSTKAYLPSDEDLLAMLDSDNMIAVEDFPYRVTKYMVIKLSPADSLNIVTSLNDGPVRYRPSSLSIGLTDGKPIFVGRLPQYPQTVFVRTGRRSIYAFHESGLLLKSAD